MTIRRSLPLLAVSLTLVLTLSPGLSSSAASDVPDGPGGPEPTHRRPVAGVVVSPADIPDKNWLPGHRGADLDAAPGDPVRASAAGTVRFAGSVAGTPTVSVDHGNGLRTTYEPVLTLVRTGDLVGQGQIIGTLADTTTLPETARRETGLHWGAVLGSDGGDSSDGERYIDPMTLLGPVQVRLWR
ncbi:M23 family metallopeptidase [Corynebacterium terpenotabidum]|uniref:Membrane metalloendopeptidase n=1 Tax=Corynebacterium terpenotabidum Y-11 TaxID=1200352 RepID=S4XKC5_9CORY|nr:M23 family metallopeptidase [Corynebacterium terpenotabidum]AGP31018.1 membrane metalloendopeptidase [Corynebacterium terpenotabidum Y-11]